MVLIINGDTTIAGNATIYGFIYLNNSVAAIVDGNALLVGGLVSTGALNIRNTANLMYSPLILNNLQNESNMRYYAKVPGSWKDY